MAGRYGNGSRWGAGVWAMVALAVALRLTVLPGYMIQAAPGALSQLTPPPVPSSAPQEQQDEGDGRAPACAFAMAGATLAAPEAQIVAAAPPSSATAPLPSATAPA